MRQENTDGKETYKLRSQELFLKQLHCIQYKYNVFRTGLRSEVIWRKQSGYINRKVFNEFGELYTKKLPG